MLLSLIRFNSLLDILLPRACLICRTVTREPHHLCQPCALELPILSHSCRKCAQFLQPSAASLICGQCLTSPPPFDIIHALYRYLPPLPRLISGLKFEAELSHAALFSTMMIRAARTEWYRHTSLPDLILPMPLHDKRLCERGFNQAAEIAKPVAKALKIPIDDNIIRIRHTKPQSSLPASERRENIAGAFTACRSYEDVHAAIIDDVVTTGQTVAALAKTLKMHGARRVDIWCCARA